MNKINLILIIVCSTILYSQTNIIQNIVKSTRSLNTIEQKKISKARSHDKAGLTKEADLIYSQLFDENPSNKQVFSAYKTFLQKHKNWDKLIDISKAHANSIESGHHGKLSLADSYLIVGEDNKAYSLFDELFELYESDLKISKHLISKLIYNNKIEYAERKISKIRQKYNTPDFYSIDLGTVYFSKMIYQKSLNEYMLYLSYNTDRADLVREKLMAFPDDDNIKQMIQEKLKSDYSKISNVILAEYYFTWENYEKAFSLMINNYLDEENLYDFSIDMILVEEFEYAEKILGHLLKSNNKNMVELSIYQLATILESQADLKISQLPISDKFIQNSFLKINHMNNHLNLKSNSITNAIVMYDSLIANFNNVEAKFKLTKLTSLINRDYEQSITDFEYLEKRAKSKDIQFLSSIEIIDLNILNNNIDKILIDKIQTYKRKYKNDEYQALLDLKLNLIYFYNKDFEAVSKNLKNKLKEISKESPYYNDYLDGMMLLMLFNNNYDELSILSDAFLSMAQGDIDIALKILADLKESKNQVASNLSSYYRSYIYTYNTNYELAIEEMKLIDGDDIFSQLSKLLLAEINDYITDDVNQAIDIYLYFLENYESSIYYEDIRLRLRELIG